MEVKYYIVYGILINLCTFLVMGYDKSQARKRGRRVPERTLFILSVMGGALGGIAGMYVWRHKTKHPSFIVGLPVIVLLQLFALYWLL